MEDYKSNIFRKIYLWWKFDGKYYHKYFMRGIKNLWRWFPTIWKDRDWDDHFIFNVLAKKLEFQAKYIGGRKFHLRAERDAEIMNLVVRLIRRVQDETYTMEYMDYHETNFDFIPTDETKQFYELHDELLSENFADYFKKYPRQYKRVMSGEINRFKGSPEEKDLKLIAMEIAHENQERCHKLLFNILENNIRRWWD